MCTASAGKGRVYGSLGNIPLLLGCSWENLVQHMQATDELAEKNPKKPKTKAKQAEDKTQPQLALREVGVLLKESHWCFEFSVLTPGATR